MNGMHAAVTHIYPLHQPVDDRDRPKTRPTPSHRRILSPDEHLFHAGELYEHAYLVRAGRLKSYRVFEDGEEQILGLHGPGDIVGFDALLGQPANHSVTAVDTSSVQVIMNPAAALEHGDDTGLARLMIEGLYRETLRLSQRLRMERHPSERRMAEFLLDFAERQRASGLDDQHLTLPISRRSLARYLGLAPETVSRTLSSFQARELIEVRNRKLAICDPAGLAALARGIDAD